MSRHLQPNNKSENPIKAANTRSLLGEIGLIGLAEIEPIILAALATGEPLLLIGPHGTGKSLMLTQIAEALGLAFRHVRRHINWNNQRPDLREDLAHLVQGIKRRICDVAGAGFLSFYA